jgi:hypothetical protein
MGNLTRIGTATKTDGWQFTAGSIQTVNGTFSATSNSNINCMVIQTSVLLQQATINIANALSITNRVDFRDIAITGPGSANLSAGLSGDCGGNSGITFTPATTQTHSGSNQGTWSFSDVTKWTSRIPLPQDLAVDTANYNTGQVISADMVRLCKSIDLSAVTWSGVATQFNRTVSSTHYGDITFAVGMTGQFSGAITLTIENRVNTAKLDTKGSLFGGVGVTAGGVIQAIAGKTVVIGALPTSAALRRVFTGMRR